jgi:hypothetical protein
MQKKRRLGIWSLTMALGFTACVGAVAGNGVVDFQVVHDIGGPAFPGAAFLAINNRADLASYVNTRSSVLPPHAAEGASVSPSPRVPPDIDFSKYTLLVFSRGPSTGHSIFFGEIRELDGEIRVRVFDMSPGPGCAVAQMITFPGAAALIPHTLKTIRFQTSQASSDCNPPHDVVVPTSNDSL